MFAIPAETAHHLSMNILSAAAEISPLRKLISSSHSSSTPVVQFGLSFRNHIGLAAGFDKNARYLNALDALGFGFLEIGTVTPLPQRGNEKPRLFRLPKDKALINRMGFNNDGVDAVYERLSRYRNVQDNRIGRMLVGGNIGKNKVTPNEEAWRDYMHCFEKLHPVVDFFVVNVSSPNTPGLRELQDKESLRNILVRLQEKNSHYNVARPILLKIAPDLTWSQIDDVIALANEIKLDGIVATNTTIDRAGLRTDAEVLSQIGNGGLSGAPLRERSTSVVTYISGKTHGSLPIIASGGIFTAADAAEKLTAGASLIEVYTGFIYEGPGIVKAILKEKVKGLQ